MSSGPAMGGDRPQDRQDSNAMFTGWRHLQRSLGGSLHASLKRSRKLSRASLRRKG